MKQGFVAPERDIASSPHQSAAQAPVRPTGSARYSFVAPDDDVAPVAYDPPPKAQRSWVDRAVQSGQATVGTAKRGWDRLAGGLARGTSVVADTIGLDGLADSARQDAAEIEAMAASPVEGARTWEDVKRDPLGNIVPFVFEQGVGGAPDMAAAVASLPFYAALRASAMGQQRAENNQTGDATLVDIAKAAPAAVASGWLERLGTSGILGDVAGSGIKAAGRAGVKEAATEAGQEAIEYAGTNLGTNVGFDPRVAAENALIGAVVGGPFGAGAHATVSALRPNTSASAAPDLQDVALDAPPSMDGNIMELLAAGVASPEQAAAMTPEFAALAAERLSARAPAATDLPVILGAPEGNVRTDDAGGILGLLRQRAIDAEVMARAQSQAPENPAIAAILESSANQRKQIASLWDRIARLDASGQREPLPDIDLSPVRIPEQPTAIPRTNSASVPGRTFDRMVQAESGGRQKDAQGNTVRSNKGAVGIAQVMPGTGPEAAKLAGLEWDPHRFENDAAYNRQLGEAYYRAQLRRFGGDERKAIAAYNAGPGGVQQAVRAARSTGGHWEDHLPTETKDYLAKVTGADARTGPLEDSVPFRVGDEGELKRRRNQDTGGDLDLEDTSYRQFENTDAPESPTRAQMESGEFFERPDGGFGPRERGGQRTYEAPMQTGDSGKAFRDVRDDPVAQQAFWEDRSRMQADELHRAWEETMRENARQANERRAQQGRERAAGGDPADRYGGYDQKPAKDGDFWRFNDEGFVAGAKGQPVAFRNAKDAAKWAAANKMGGDVDAAVWKANSTRIVLRRRAGSTYGQQAADAAAPDFEAPPQRAGTARTDFERWQPPAGRSSDASQRVIGAEEAPRAPGDDGPSPGAPQPPPPPPSPSPAGPSAPYRGSAEGRQNLSPSGRPGEQVVTPSGTRLDTEFDVIEARDLITSDRPEFDQRFQPRDRGGRAASDAQIAEIASGLDPEQLRSSRLASQGAPIIGPDRMVESGNGRTAAIRRAYELHPERAAEYRKMVDDMGFDTAGMEAPVLVRRRVTPLDDDARAAFTRDAQSGGTMRLSPSEQAKADAKATSDDVLALYRGGDVNSAGNREFARKFVERTVGPDERNFMQMPDGSLSAPGVQRIRAAMLAKAYDNPALIEKIVSDPETEIKAIGNVLTDLAPAFAGLKAKIARGDLPAEFDITPQLGEIAGIIAQARRDGRLVTEFLEQDDIFAGRTDPITEALANIMLKGEGLSRPRSAREIADGLNFYLRDAEQVGPSLLGDNMSDRALQIAQAAAEKLKARDNGANQSTLFGRRAARAGSRKPDRFYRLTRELAELDGTAEQRALAAKLRDLLGDDDLVAYGRQHMLNPSSRGEAEIEGQRAFVREQGDIETLLHEAVHLATMSRYGWEFEHLQPGDAASTPARALLGLFNEARGMVADGKRGRGLDPDVRHALSSPDEFLASALTNKPFQAWLDRGTLWDRAVDVVRRLLGLDIRARSLLSDVMRAGRGVLDGARSDDRRVTAQRGRQSRVGPGSLIDRIVDRDGLARDAETVKRAVGDPKGSLKSVLRGMDSAASALFYSNDARLRGLAARFDSPAIDEIADAFHAEAGKGKGTARTYHEAVESHATRNVQRMYEALEPYARDKAAMRRIQDLLRFPDKRQRATKPELDAAQKVRDLLKAEIDYRKAAGEDIGEVSDGYFPRILDVEKVVKQREEFLRRAESLYRKHGVDDPATAAKAWFERVFDTYSGIDGGLDHFGRAGQGGIGGNTAKGREFSKEADSVLADFYGDDTMAMLSAYFHGSARRAEYSRRFGKPGAVGSKEREAWEAEHGDKTQMQVYEDRIKADLRSSDEDAAGALRVVEKVIQSNLGQLGADIGKGTRNVASYLHAWNQLQKLDRTTVTSLAELSSGFIRGGPRYGLPFVRDSLKEFGRNIVRAAPSDAKNWADAIGVGQDAMVSQMLMSRAGIDGQGTSGTQRALAGFYRATLLHQFTEGTRAAAVTMGRKYLDVLARDIGSTTPKVAKRAEFLLRELGVSDPDSFGKAVREGRIDIARARDGKDVAASDYVTALVRFANQTIMMPSRAAKPTLANHPVGSLFYSLLSWSYSFKKNVLDRAGRLTIKGIRERDPKLLAPALGLALTMLWSDIVDSKVRPFLFGSSYDFDKETATEHFMRVADRSGLTGALSPVVNAVKGLRYRRSLAESVSGPAIGTLLGAGDKVLGAAFGQNSPNTNTAERNAARAIYQTTIEPAADAIAAARLKGIFSTAGVLSTGNREGGVMPGDEDWFVDSVAGKASK